MSGAINTSKGLGTELSSSQEWVETESQRDKAITEGQSALRFRVAESGLASSVTTTNCSCQTRPNLFLSLLKAPSYYAGLARTAIGQPEYAMTAGDSLLCQSRVFHPSPSASATMNQAMKRGKKPLRRTALTSAPLLERCPQKKGFYTQIMIRTPKRLNSAKRKVARVKLSNGESVMAYIQGEGHNLQEHSVVLVRGGRVKDLPGVRQAVIKIAVTTFIYIPDRYHLVRGALDFGGVPGRQSARSKYGVKKPKK
ncbi:hypothetical protein VNI00_002436 [Paramarasmius palmivorus]|uniref:Ribosomal protein S12 n=1 Tax=Paramarasmius palmivorus TaxID=297713 RepID=A0AAW0DZJ9_9AGAR